MKSLGASLCAYLMSLKNCLRFVLWTTPILIRDGIRLFCFVVVLTPGFMRFAWYYWVVAERTSVKYGHDSCRQTLDVYEHCKRRRIPDSGTSDDSSEEPMCPRPVVVFATGGAWLIGYKMWGALLARALAAAGLIVVIPDYRNYPWATVPSMVDDLETALVWTKENIADYNGDPDKIVLVGQSAGGHICCTALLRRALRILPQLVENSEETESSPREKSFQKVSIKGFIALSTPFDLEAMRTTFAKHGLDNHLVDRIFGGEADMYTPSRLVERIKSNGHRLEGIFPSTRIFHGSSDKTVPFEASKDFSKELMLVATNVEFQVYDGYSHTDAILEGPMDGDHFFHRDIFELVKVWTETRDLEWKPEIHSMGRICPHFLIRPARLFIPF